MGDGTWTSIPSERVRPWVHPPLQLKSPHTTTALRGSRNKLVSFPTNTKKSRGIHAERTPNRRGLVSLALVCKLAFQAHTISFTMT